MLPQYHNGMYPDKVSTDKQGTYQNQMSENYPSPADALRYSTDAITATIETNIQNDLMKACCDLSRHSSDQNIPFVPIKDRKNRLLSKSFLPGPRDVICARGKEARNHPGNVLMRSLVDRSVRAYESAQTRTDKTKVVSEILCQFGWSPSLNRFPCTSDGEEVGGFVKQDGVTGRWYTIDEASAREKICQSLRERLHSKYKSSTKAKRQKNRAMAQKLKDKQEQQVTGSVTNLMSNRMNVLGETLKEIVGSGDTEDSAFDRLLEEQMTKTNLELINILKQCSP